MRVSLPLIASWLRVFHISRRVTDQPRPASVGKTDVLI
jgi:hypothetical protein